MSDFSGVEFDEEEVKQDIKEEVKQEVKKEVKEEVKEEGSESGGCDPNIIYKKLRQLGDGSKLNRYAHK